MNDRGGRLRTAAREMIKALYAMIVVMLTFVFMLVRYIADALRSAFQFLCKISCWIVRLAIVGILIAISIITLPIVWTAYGADLPATIPAIMVIVIPIAVAVGSRVGWNALLAAAVAILCIGQAIAVADLTVRAALIIAVLTVTILYDKIGSGDQNGKREEQ